MLVKFDTVTVFDVSPVYDQPTEFEVTNSLGPVLVRRDGRHMISNVLGDTILGYQMIYRNTKFSSLTGVIYYNNNRYKVVPRTIADFGTITNVKAQRELAFPETYALEQNYPNPFNPSTTIRYSIPEAGYVSLRVYNLLGQEVAGLIDYEQAAGTYTVRFDGSSLSSGVYLYRIRCGNFVQVHKMMLLK
jgi:hypothetical protein